MPTVDLSERDNKETLFVKEEVTNDAEVFGEVEVDVEESQKEPLSRCCRRQDRQRCLLDRPQRCELNPFY